MFSLFVNGEADNSKVFEQQLVIICKRGEDVIEDGGVGNIIKERRLEIKLTQTELAVKMDVSLRTFQRWESGIFSHRFSLYFEAKRLGQIFKCSPSLFSVGGVL